MKSYCLPFVLLLLCLPTAHARQSPTLTTRLKSLRAAPLQPQALRTRLSKPQVKSLRGQIAGFARKQTRKKLSDTEIKAFLISIAFQAIESSAPESSGKPTSPLTQELLDVAKSRNLTPELRALAQRAPGRTDITTMQASKTKEKAADAADKAVDKATDVAKDAAKSAAETATDAVDYAADVAKAVVDWLAES